MRATLVVMSLAAMAAPALAENVCSLRVVEAPSEIRDALFGWASGEKMCHSLEVRITPTGEGYSLWARADDGRTFTRWVADPKTAALLVVSWAGDDTLPEADPPPRSRSTLRTHVRQMVPQERPTAIATIASPTTPRRELVVAGIFNAPSGEDVNARGGIRASIDLTTHEEWRLGIAGMLSDEEVRIYDFWTGQRLATAYEPRFSLVGYISRSLLGDHLRLSAGAGFTYAQLSDVQIEPLADNVMMDRIGILTPAFEVSALGSVPITRRWSITGGLVIVAASFDLLKNGDHEFAPDHDGGTQVVGTLGLARSL